MKIGKSWQFFGGASFLSYKLFDTLRRQVNRKLVTYLCTKAILKKESLVLEAGSGPGYSSSLFARDRDMGLSIAVDIDPEALCEARRRNGTLPVVIADLYHLPFKSGTFDLTWNSSTLEHLEKMDSSLREMARVTTRNGYVFVGVPYRWGPLGVQMWIKRTSIGIWIGPVFSKSELANSMRQAGLEPENTILYFFRFFVGSLARKPR
jgi:SAM-dependent methyltransferase